MLKLRFDWYIIMLVDVEPRRLRGRHVDHCLVVKIVVLSNRKNSGLNFLILFGGEWDRNILSYRNFRKKEN